MSIFEIVMLVCFGAAWPFSIYRSCVARSTRGKSLAFLIILLCGYTAGILHKVLRSMDGVIVLYCLNWCMVAADTVLFIRNSKLEAGCIDE